MFSRMSLWPIRRKIAPEEALPDVGDPLAILAGLEAASATDAPEGRDVATQVESEADEIDHGLLAAFHEEAPVDTASNRLASTVESVDAAQLAAGLRALVQSLASHAGAGTGNR